MIKLNECLACNHKDCKDINTGNFIIPSREIDPDKVKIIMISEAPPDDLRDYFYSEGNQSKRIMIAEDLKEALEIIKV
ncbi:MAG: hypothetical protein M0Z31_07230 [Clostridia bacterium]|nr:hypothetical protein [Clostridia bacterium]